MSTAVKWSQDIMALREKDNAIAITGLVILTLIWSYSWIAMKQVTHYIGAFDFTAMRCVFSALCYYWCCISGPVRRGGKSA